MLAFIRAYQTYIILVLSGICAMIAFFAFLTKYPSRKRKISQLIIALSTMTLLISEILGAKYAGETTRVAYRMVRICNFLIYMMTLFVIHSFTLYLIDLIRVDMKQRVPRRLVIIMYFTMLGEALVVISQFTGLYYTIDAANVYHRSQLYAVSYLFPLLSILLLVSVILGRRKMLRTGVWISLLLFTAIPLAAAILQFFAPDLYVTDMAIVGMVVILYVVSLLDTNRSIESARERELQLLKSEQEHTQKLFRETAVALVNAIDAKDAYTHGHSARVAKYAGRIAEISGKDEEECENIYYAALLHDVGKIGVPNAIINKEGELTAEEFGVMKTHAEIGYQILSEITDFPYLSVAARHHHERYDGTGYPDGLIGREIPESARIISVADAYDAMTSSRRYRKQQLSREKARSELLRCAGTQFDPVFAQIMAEMIEQDTENTMRENGDQPN